MAHTFPIEKTFTVFGLVNDRGQLEHKKDCSTRDEAEKWLDENAEPKLYYVIIEIFRRQ